MDKFKKGYDRTDELLPEKLNAVVELRSEVMVDDRLEITSPGMLLNNVTIAKMMEGYSKPRNPAIARAFAYMKIIEKWGTGIPRLFEACEEYGLPKPELIDFDGDFRVNMYRKRGTNAETNRETGTNIETNTKTNTEMLDTDTESVERILSLMREKPAITVKTIAQQLELSVGGVRYHINKLKKDGIVCEEQWEKQQTPKVYYFLKEAYTSNENGYNLVEDLHDCEQPWTMWRKIAIWTQAIHNAFSQNMCEYDEFRRYDILKDNGRISHKQAVEKAYQEYQALPEKEKVGSEIEYHNHHPFRKARNE